MNIYLACALTHVPREHFDSYVRFIHSLAAAIRRETGAEVKYALVNSDPQLADKPFEDRARLCYLWDREMVQHADLVVAETSFPSTGLGIELQIAEANGIPLIVCFKKSPEHRIPPVEYETPDHARHNLQIGEGYVSLMALGLPTIFKLIAYEEDDAGINCIVRMVQLFRSTSM